MPKALLAAISSAIIIGSSLLSAVAVSPASAATGQAGGDPSGIGIQPGGAKVVSDQSLYNKARKSSDWVLTPDGMSYFSCVHYVPPGAKLDSINDTITLASGAVQKFSACQYPRLVNPAAAASSTVASPAVPAGTTSWLGSMWSDPGTPISAMSATYSVPEAPTNSGAHDFMFSSLENGSTNTILQPVVGYGGIAEPGKPSTANEGGNYLWMVAYYNWGGNDVAAGDLYKVSYLDTIQTYIDSSGCSSTGADCTWVVSMTDENTGQTSAVTVGSDPSFLYAQGGVLESSITSSADCDELFANGHSVFRNITFSDQNNNPMTPDWYINDQVSYCNMQVEDSGNPQGNSIDILYTP